MATDWDAFWNSYKVGTLDCAARLNEAVGLAGNETVRFPVGIYRFTTRPAPFPYGVNLRGDDCTAHVAAGFGTQFSVEYNETGSGAFLNWDGSHSAGYRGTGGGIHNITIVAKGGNKPGTAIRLSGAGDNFRAGYFLLHRVGIVVENIGSEWQKGLHINGTNLVTPGAAGLRNTRIYALDTAGCHIAIHAANATHLYMAASQFNAGLLPRTGVILTGENLFVDTTNINGDLDVNDARWMTWMGGRVGGNVSFNRVHTVMFTAPVGGRVSQTDTCYNLKITTQRG